MTSPALTGPSGVPGFVISRVPGFASSPEFMRLAPELRSSPGLVMAQLAIMLRRLESASEATADRETLAAIYQVLEEMALSPQVDIQNLVVVEVLEHLHGPPQMLEKILRGFGPETRRLYEAWVERGPDEPQRL